MDRCSSCNIEVTDDFTKFKCPSCGKVEIIRCNRCKSISKKYKCSNCSFIGP